MASQVPPARASDSKRGLVPWQPGVVAPPEHLHSGVTPKLAKGILVRALCAEGPTEVWTKTKTGKARKIKVTQRQAALHNLTAKIQEMSLSDNPYVILGLMTLIRDTIDGKPVQGVVVQKQRVTNIILDSRGGGDQAVPSREPKEVPEPEARLVDPAGEGEFLEVRPPRGDLR